MQMFFKFSFNLFSFADNSDGYPINYDTGRLMFSHFDVRKVLEKGARLMGSEGTEFDQQEEFENDNREHLMRQRALLNEKLGFNSASTLGININDLVTLDDMRSVNRNTYDPNNKLMPVQEVLNLSVQHRNVPLDCSSQSAASLSCREINRARRKARQNPEKAITQATSLSRSNSVASNGSNAPDHIEPENKVQKLDYQNDIHTSGGSSNISSSGGGRATITAENHTNNSCTNNYNNSTVGEPVPDGTGSWGDAIDWPLESFCSRLYLDLFNARWETRHGAATALRELLKTHSSGVGKNVFMTKEEMDVNHMLWLEDAVLRLLCVLALDRFGDFISDQVVAPVRETCAQVLGTIMKDMPMKNVENTIYILLSLVKQEDWEVRHGGLLGIKYLLVVREDLLQSFLPLTINNILTGLFDRVDDVGAVAASTLIPIASWLPKLLTAAQVSSIVKMLWDLLLDQDELTSACNSFMGLLSAILSLNDASKWIQ